MSVAVIDWGVSNLCSVVNAVAYLGYEVYVASQPEELAAAERIILPGQGTFGAAMERLIACGMDDALRDAVRVDGKPLMGICLGMQILARTGEEYVEGAGLGLMEADVRRLMPDDPALKLPHVGWNEIAPSPDCTLLRGLKPKDRCVYFAHSYALYGVREEEVAAVCDYGGGFVAAILRDNLFATQFHPEKSQENGLDILDRFLTWRP